VGYQPATRAGLPALRTKKPCEGSYKPLQGWLERFAYSEAAKLRSYPSPYISLAFVNFFLHNPPIEETRPVKKFDCVEFKRKAQTEIFEETRGMTPEQEIAYFNRKAETGRVGKWWKKIRKASGA
jgi:hypothetical protein